MVAKAGLAYCYLREYSVAMMEEESCRRLQNIMMAAKAGLAYCYLRENSVANEEEQSLVCITFAKMQ